MTQSAGETATEPETILRDLNGSRRSASPCNWRVAMSSILQRLTRPTFGIVSGLH